MSTQEVLKIVEDRGLKVVLRDGQPKIVGQRDKQHISDELLAVLKIHKQRIVDILKRQ